jgi:CubicO group peptidase (beta-lactamase class C family)
MGADEAGINDLRGVVLAVRQGSTIVHAAGGPADVDTGVACTTDTRFAIASVSKQFTAAAVLLLVERGVVALNDPLSRWFGQSPSWWRQVTVHQVLTHTSGLGHWQDVGGIEGFCALNVDQRLAAIQATTPRVTPGRQWSYSGLGYLLLGQIVERIESRSYGSFLQAEIFSPLGMAATSSGPEPTSQPTAHGHHDGTRVPVLELTTPQAPLGEEAYNLDWIEAHSYGYGYFTGSLIGRPAAFHPGDNPGYQSFSASIPDSDTSVVVLLNDDAPDLRSTVHTLAATILT